MSTLTDTARALGVKHKANRAGDMVVYGPDYGTEGADHGRGAEVACVAEDDYTVVGHEDDGDYRNLGSFSTARAALEAALSFVHKE
ncbi:MAG: hypothetical protein ACRDI2_16065 [Chloroflexota bacterium]